MQKSEESDNDYNEIEAAQNEEPDENEVYIRMENYQKDYECPSDIADGWSAVETGCSVGPL